MSSWNLLRHLFGSGKRYRHNPVFRHEIRQQFYIFRSTLPELGSMVLVILSVLLLLLAFYLGMPLSWCFFVPICIPLSLCFLAYPLVVLTAVSTLAPVIARERAQRTWETLRVTPLPVETIVLGKAHAAIFKLHDQTIRLLIGLTLVMGSLVTALVLLVRRSGAPLSNDPTANGLLTLLLLASGLLFFAERAQQAALFSAAALVVSASVRSTRTALAGTLASTFILWTADLLIVQLLVTALPRQGEVSPLAVLWLGSTVAYGVLDSLSTMYLCIALTFVLREIAVRVLWRWAVRAARAV